jgi:NADH-quinone oxidoreductase subunit A
MNDLFFLLTFLLLASVFAVASIVAGFVVGYKSEDVDNSVYECGMKLFGNAKIQFDVKFLNFAILFLIFDVEVFFLFPLAVNLGEVDLYVFLEGIIFTLIFLFTLFYSIKKNILRWF